MVMDPAVTGIGQVQEVVWVVRVRPATTGNVVVDVRSEATAATALAGAARSAVDFGARIGVRPRFIHHRFQDRLARRLRSRCPE